MNIIKKYFIIFLIIALAFSFFGNLNFSYALNDKGGAGGGASNGKQSEQTLRGAFDGAEGFVQEGEKELDNAIDIGKLSETSDYIYNILLAIGMIIAVVVGSILGIKFMISSVEEQAKIKELLVPYVAGCVVIFGAFGIWKIAVNLFKVF